MRAREAIRREPVHLPPDATIGEAARLLDTAAVGAVVVIDPETSALVGIVTDRDLVVRGLARGLAADARIDAVMSMDVVVIDADADLHDAVGLFSTHPFRRIPVMSGGKLVGMLTVDDLLVDLSCDLGNLVRGVTAQVLFGHPEPQVPAPQR
jgi:CBS domain-containing protein